MKRLPLVIEGFIAANQCDSMEAQKIGKKLKFPAYDLYNKPQLAVLAEELGFEWRKVDNGVWVNQKGGTPLTDEEIQEELTEERKRHG